MKGFDKVKKLLLKEKNVKQITNMDKVFKLLMIVNINSH